MIMGRKTHHNRSVRRPEKEPAPTRLEINRMLFYGYSLTQELDFKKVREECRLERQDHALKVEKVRQKHRGDIPARLCWDLLADRREIVSIVGTERSLARS